MVVEIVSSGGFRSDNLNARQKLFERPLRLSQSLGCPRALQINLRELERVVFLGIGYWSVEERTQSLDFLTPRVTSRKASPNPCEQSKSQSSNKTQSQLHCDFPRFTFCPFRRLALSVEQMFILQEDELL